MRKKILAFLSILSLAATSSAVVACEQVSLPAAEAKQVIERIKNHNVTLPVKRAFLENPSVAKNPLITKSIANSLLLVNYELNKEDLLSLKFSSQQQLQEGKTINVKVTSVINDQQASTTLKIFLTPSQAFLINQKLLPLQKELITIAAPAQGASKYADNVDNASKIISYFVDHTKYSPSLSFPGLLTFSHTELSTSPASVKMQINDYVLGISFVLNLQVNFA